MPAFCVSGPPEYHYGDDRGDADLERAEQLFAIRPPRVEERADAGLRRGRSQVVHLEKGHIRLTQQQSCQPGRAFTLQNLRADNGA